MHLACRAAKPRRVHSCRRKRRSAKSVTASLPRCSVAAPTASRGSRVEASQRCSANSVAASQCIAASLPRRSVAPASQRQQSRSAGPASERQPQSHSGYIGSVAAPPAPGSVTAQRRKLTFWPPCPSTVKSNEFLCRSIVLYF